MANPTIEKFGFPETLVREFRHWMLLVRPQQPTLGSMVLAAKSDCTSFGSLPTEAFAEQGSIIPALEAALARLTGYERLNYLMLMMVDPNVHFHVIPRYSEPRSWDGMEFPDPGWPGPPDLGTVISLDLRQIESLARSITELFDPFYQQI